MTLLTVCYSQRSHPADCETESRVSSVVLNENGLVLGGSRVKGNCVTFSLLILFCDRIVLLYIRG